MDWIITSLTSIVIFGAALIHGIAGFGFAQVSMGLLPLFRSASTASVIFNIAAVFSNSRVFWSVRKDFRVNDWLVPVGGLALGMPLGIYIFQGLSEAQLRLAIGAILILGVVVMVPLQEKGRAEEWIRSKGIRPGWKTGFTVGLLSGVLGGSVAIPGPPMILYGAFMLANDLWESPRMKAVCTAFFGTLMAYRLAALTITGAVTWPLALEALVTLPALFVGAWIGIRIYRKVPERIFGWLVLSGLTANALVLISSSI
ncbi:MAG: sulfite exporter TauE/SafE family protein [Methanomassiliicoccales archaeon]